MSLHRESSSFNLVIENLIFSSALKVGLTAGTDAFQSRNRESYLFKIALGVELYAGIHGFNLVIENLIFSRRGFSHERSRNIPPFQSRNRESYLFKGMKASR